MCIDTVGGLDLNWRIPKHLTVRLGQTCIQNICQLIPFDKAGRSSLTADSLEPKNEKISPEKIKIRPEKQKSSS